MKIAALNNKNVPLVAIDKSLDKYEGKIMFPEKLERANKMLKNAKLPEKRHHR